MFSLANSLKRSRGNKDFLCSARWQTMWLEGEAPIYVLIIALV